MPRSFARPMLSFAAALFMPMLLAAQSAQPAHPATPAKTATAAPAATHAAHAATPATSATPASPAASTTQPGAAAKAVTPARDARGRFISKKAAAVTATCNDGSAWSGKGRSGACARHGGVKSWN